MGDLISREALIDSLEKEQQIYEDNCSLPSFWTALSVIRHLPTVEAVPVVHGEWIDEFGKFLLLYKCSECSSEYPWNTNFCPNCGCDMRTSAE